MPPPCLPAISRRSVRTGPSLVGSGESSGQAAGRRLPVGCTINAYSHPQSLDTDDYGARPVLLPAAPLRPGPWPVGRRLLAAVRAVECTLRRAGTSVTGWPSFPSIARCLSGPASGSARHPASSEALASSGSPQPSYGDRSWRVTGSRTRLGSENHRSGGNGLPDLVDTAIRAESRTKTEKSQVRSPS